MMNDDHQNWAVRQCHDRKAYYSALKCVVVFIEEYPECHDGI